MAHTPTEHAAVLALRGVHHHNLRGFDLEIPQGKLVVVTGVSGSGKSSLAFDTLHAEGQRRYIECLSSYARQFIERMDKPQVDSITGILPSVALRQGKSIRAARSTVATITEIGESFRLLFTHAAEPNCPQCGSPVQRVQIQAMVEDLLSQGEGRRLVVGFAVPIVSPLAARAACHGLAQAGYHRAWHKDAAHDLDTTIDSLEMGQPLHVIQDRLVLQATDAKRLADSLDQALRRGDGLVHVWVQGSGIAPQHWQPAPTESDIFQHFHASERLQCLACGTAVANPSPQLFSFNSAVGACESCNGFGRLADIDWGRVVPDPSKSLRDGAIKPWSTEATKEERRDLEAFCLRQEIDFDQPWRDLSETQRQSLFDGEKGGWRAGRFYGLRGWFKWLEGKTYKMHVRVLLARYRAYVPCPSCGGARLKATARAWRVQGLDLPTWLGLPVGEVRIRLGQLQTSVSVARALEQPLRDLRKRIDFLDEVGLHYLSLDRAARTLSGGELQRVQLVAALATGLSQVLYVLDEPSVGLHPRDNDKLLQILQRLRAAGNTVVVVEHDPALIRAADMLIDLGPGAGEKGGQLLYAGPTAGVMAVPESLTGDYLSGRKQVNLARETPLAKLGSVRASRGRVPQWLTIVAPTARTLRGQDVQLQLGALNAICGVSGSGKSTLVDEVLYRNLLRARGESVDEPGPCGGILGSDSIRQVVLVDQELPHGSTRANCATYLKVWDGIRARLAGESLAISKGFTEATFSFNREGGRCAVCEGLGVELVDMQFLSDVRMTCEACEGQRFQADVLQVRYRGLNAYDFLQRTAGEIAEQFSDDPGLAAPMQQLSDLGLGYLRLGQPLATMSGGEAQRLKIAWHLLSARTRGGLFLLDEPSTGLHLHDVANLLHNLRLLVDSGNTVVLIEHHLDLLAAADWLVELGPEGGPAGGQVLFQGNPLELLPLDTPTARHLRRKDVAATGLRADLSDVDLDPGVIQVRGAQVHNLKNISVDVPRTGMTVVTGLSGSGKSSLAFDVIFAEGQRRFLDCLSPFARQYLPPILRPDVQSLLGLPPTVAIAQRTTRGGSRSTVATLTDIYPYLRLLFARCGEQHCPDCGGLVSGQSASDVADAIAGHFGKQPIYLMAPVVRGRKGQHKDVIARAQKTDQAWLQVDGRLVSAHGIPELRRHVPHDIDAVVARLQPRQTVDYVAEIFSAVQSALAQGDGTVLVRTADSAAVTYSLRRYCPSCDKSVQAPDPRLFTFTSSAGWCPACTGTGIYDPQAEAKAEAKKKARKKKKKDDDGRSTAELQRAGMPDGGEIIADQAVRLAQTCSACQGSRLAPAARAVTLGGRGIDQWMAQGPLELLAFLAETPWPERQQAVAGPIIAEVVERCRFLDRVGLHYLSLGRGAPTLSGGESQRIRLAAQLSSNLQGVLYVLDEPTIGLHAEDNRKVLDCLGDLVKHGAGLLVVEHDEETILRADSVLELGPGGGHGGGEVIFQGSVQALLACADSPTGQALKPGGIRKVRDQARPIVDSLGQVRLIGAARNNLRNVDATIQRGRFNVVTGVSGSGKSTLVRDMLVVRGNLAIAGEPCIDEELREISGLDGIGRVVEVDQSPIGRTPRSCPATYMGIFDDIRKIFAALPDAKVAGVRADRFGFNSGEGRCPQCLGSGELRVEMAFLPTARVPCETCAGARYRPEILQIRHKGASIGDVLTMNLAEAAEHFAAHAGIAKPLKLATQMGLGYLQLGQSSDTLSGGEAQRLKIVSELAKSRRTGSLYVLDEPSTGLHLQDVRKLLTVLHDLVDRGDTLVVIEHQLDIVREADWVIDLGPGAGTAGGCISFQGPLAELLASGPDGPTRRALLTDLHAGLTKRPSKR